MISNTARPGTVNEANYQLNLEWILGIPCVTARFGHREEKSFPAMISVNPKGRTDSRVLEQYLRCMIDTLNPDASDTPGYCKIFKIHGGPGQLGITNLAQPCAR
jgi:hypothetical protein